MGRAKSQKRVIHRRRKTRVYFLSRFSTLSYSRIRLIFACTYSLLSSAQRERPHSLFTRNKFQSTKSNRKFPSQKDEKCFCVVCAIISDDTFKIYELLTLRAFSPTIRHPFKDLNEWKRAVGNAKH